MADWPWLSLTDVILASGWQHRQITEGHEYILRQFNVRPTVAWQIDPFGHSSLTPTLFAQMGYKALVINRIHHSLKVSLDIYRPICSLARSDHKLAVILQTGWCNGVCLEAITDFRREDRTIYPCSPLPLCSAKCKCRGIILSKRTTSRFSRLLSDTSSLFGPPKGFDWEESNVMKVSAGILDHRASELVNVIKVQELSPIISGFLE